MAVPVPLIASYWPKTGNGVSTSNTLTLDGTAAANSSVEILDGATLLGTVAVDGNGIWTFKTGLLSDGAHSFTVVDTTGTSSAALQATVAADIASFSSADNSHIYVDGASYLTEAVNPAYSISSSDSHTLRFEVRKGDVWGGYSGERAEIAGGLSYASDGTTTVNLSYDFMLEPGPADMLPGQTTATNINLYQDPNPIQQGHWYSRRNEICL